MDIYKSILWIDDFDDTQGSARKKPGSNNLMQKQSSNLNYFSEKYREMIEIKDNFFDAIKEIMQHKDDYDLIILDVKMNKNFMIDRNSNIWGEFTRLVELSEEEDSKGEWTMETMDYVIFGTDNEKKILIKKEITEHYLQENAGYYMAVLLLTLGFPRDRIILYTAFGMNSNWDLKFKYAAMKVPEIVEKDKFNTENINMSLDKHYQGTNKYYWLRAFVINIGNFFSKRIEMLEEGKRNINNAEYPNIQEQNKAYIQFLKDCIPYNRHISDNNRLDIDELKDIRKSIINEFGIHIPNKIEKCQDKYFQTIKNLTLIFETSFKPDASDSIYRTLKLFRNWTAHPIFDKNQIFREEYFITLALIICEEYFSLEEQSEEYYERIADELSSDRNYNIDENMISEVINRYLELCEKYNLTFSNNIIDNLDLIGRKKNANTYYYYLFMAYIICKCKKPEPTQDNNTINIKYEFAEMNMHVRRTLYWAYHSFKLGKDDEKLKKSK